MQALKGIGMSYLILGLVIFLGVHSVRMVASAWRDRMRTRFGEAIWKLLYSALSVTGLGLVIWGFGVAREQPLVLWTPPAALRYVTDVLTVVAFVLLCAAYVPGNRIKARVHHPMVLSVAVWAFAHLLSNGTLTHAVLFGLLLVWAWCSFMCARRRDRAAGAVYPAGAMGRTMLTVLLGVVSWALTALWLHGLTIGIRPVS
jgi:uncharacterized membrane protein